MQQKNTSLDCVLMNINTNVKIGISKANALLGTRMVRRQGLTHQ